MIKQKQAARASQMESLIDGLAAKYGGQSKAKKRKAAPASGKSKRRKWCYKKISYLYIFLF